MPHFAEMVFQLGGVPTLASIPFGPLARYYFVDKTNGSDGNDDRSLDHAMATIAAAYAKTISGRHDTIFIVGTSSNNIASTLTWSNSQTHLIGICAPTGIAQRARIFQTSGTTNVSPLLNITGSGCIFKNFYIFQGVDAGSLIDVAVTGGRNYFENVHFAGCAAAANAINGGASLSLSGDENRFVHCTIGVDTSSNAAGCTGLLFPSAANAARNVFETCLFLMNAAHKGAYHVEAIGNTSLQRYTVFRHSLFLNYNVVAFSINTVFAIPGASTGWIVLDDCWAHGADDWEDADTGYVLANSDVMTSGGNSGLLLATTVS